ncbi:hypothetical protein BpHYR1_051471 [Brachionus plicatilis]|uniref:Uncharacterized protein n=1 Tax=Brachionus plicatilis TaxID=10195 RepID=A0A3M7S2X7_BRAPC|nr:hypothetical protein BpHYR1_051471 [Brachionus plicatilis]
MGKLRSLKNNNLANSKNKNAQNEDKYAENTDLDRNINEIEEVKKPSLLKKVQFKKNKKDNKSTLAKFKKTDDANKEKYESIKTNLLKQIKLSDNASGEDCKKVELNFVNRTSRLTNSMLKSILKNNSQSDVIKKLGPKSKNLVTIKEGKNISKKAKDKLKKNVWQERIGLIKNQLKEKNEKAKREKTVITGDMKPMIDSLEKFDKSVLFQDKSNNLQNLTRKEKREKNLINQKTKVTQRQSIRDKTSNDDINLFNQLSGYSEFTKNPLNTLKKHLTK